ncbi:SLATT domain-containing protein [Pectinatus frisingensis]|uniref:SLATT domain-containing protein n=1 Tax=Pectinatus frisingensis TaxID=865 RepID=UPI003D802B99
MIKICIGLIKSCIKHLIKILKSLIDFFSCKKAIEIKHDPPLKKLLHDLDYTSKNCSRIYNRLKMYDVVSKKTIVIYSFFSIILSIMPKYFSISNINLLDFLSVITSIALLIASLGVSLANYHDRAKNAMTCLNGLKRMKKALESTKDTDSGLTEKRDIYNRIVQNMEIRTDLDFFKTCKEDDFEYHSFPRYMNIYYYIKDLLINLFSVILNLLPFLPILYLLFIFTIYIYYSPMRILFNN